VYTVDDLTPQLCINCDVLSIPQSYVINNLRLTAQNAPVDFYIAMKDRGVKLDEAN